VQRTRAGTASGRAVQDLADSRLHRFHSRQSWRSSRKGPPHCPPYGTRAGSNKRTQQPERFGAAAPASRQTPIPPFNAYHAQPSALLANADASAHSRCTWGCDRRAAGKVRNAGDTRQASDKEGRRGRRPGHRHDGVSGSLGGLAQHTDVAVSRRHREVPVAESEDARCGAQRRVSFLLIRQPSGTCFRSEQRAQSHIHSAAFRDTGCTRASSRPTAVRLAGGFEALGG